MNKRFARIGDILPAVLKSVGLDRKLKEREVLAAWPGVVGPEIAARTEAVHIDEGVLHVKVDHGAWMQELHFMERELIGRLREVAPGIRLQRIRLEARGS